MAKDESRPQEEQKKDPAFEKALAGAKKAFGIGDKHVLHARPSSEAGQVVIVTHGGKKVRWKEGDKVEPLSQVELDGVPTKKPRHVAGKKKSTAIDQEPGKK